MAITIIKTSGDLSKVEKYLMTTSPAIKSFKDLPDGAAIAVKHYCLFEDKKENGDVCELLTVMGADNEVYASVSETLKKSLFEIDDIMGGEPYTIIKCSGTTKSGRQFINCTLDVSKIM